MSRAILDPIPDRIISAQRSAADPGASAWVEANAGSGKTHVLTERVLRLLLSGVKPESILCLTYTKAAAAEMRRRVSASLARWALLEESALALALEKLAGRVASAEERRRARTLFAHALETPGGLKINTIHAFCEALLHRFPLEAQVPIDFSVIEDEERVDLVRRAREITLAQGLADHPDLAGAVDTLFAALSDDALVKAVDTALAEGRKLRAVLRDRPAAKANLRRLVGLPRGETSASVWAGIASGSSITAGTIAAVQALTPGEKGGNRFEDRLLSLDPAHPDPELLLAIFLTAEGTVRKSLLKKKAAEADPVLADTIAAEAERLVAVLARHARARLVERSEALLDILGAIVDRYEAGKRARSRLDFDDLIAKVGTLLTRSDLRDWVLFKLDAAITHILVDESQDTNPEQWRVVDAIVSEFFAGDGAVAAPRTVFAVGDQKQSIYSFQGAEPALFAEAGRRYARLAQAADRRFARVPLHTSFRTLANVLSAVDLVFDDPVLREAVLAPPDAPVHHETARADAGGQVVLWPPIQDAAEPPAGSDWPTGPDLVQPSAVRRVADHIAATIARWIAERRPLGRRGRSVAADDVLILVQSRGALFAAIIRALMEHRLVTPGADRLKVTGHIAVLDLLALGDVLLNPSDDLQLAALLRSPLFEVGEDDLFALAADRPKGQSLWQALAASPLPAAVAARARLTSWRERLDFERPFEFFAQVLYADGGLRRFHARLGIEIDDVFSEFLDLALAHEQTAQPSLQGFVAAMRARDVEIKRELAEAGGVRVMTVHGAKGLEAPIVILADAATRPGDTPPRSVFVVPDTPGPLLVHAGPSGDHTPETLAIKQQAADRRDAEYWRKLYVAMTRAEDELYITGALTKTGKLDGTWYEAAERALAPLALAEKDAEGNPQSLTYPLERPAPLAVVDAAAGAIAAAQAIPPVPGPIASPLETPFLSPSRLGHGADRGAIFETAAERVRDPDLARREGLALHALLQHLPRIPRKDWPAVLPRAAGELLADAPDRQAAVMAKAEAILARSDLAPWFGPHSRAEVPFLIALRRNGAPVRLGGRIDRLAVAGKNLLILDYKSDANVPSDPASIPPAYATQLALYALAASQLFPGLEVKAAIFWTTLESLMELPADLLASAAAGFTTE